MIGSFSIAAVCLAFSLQTSLYDLVGMDASVAELRSGTENTILVVACASTPEISHGKVKDFIASLPPEYRSVETASDFSKLSISPSAVTSEDAELLWTPKGREKIAKRAIRRYIASPLPPMFSPEEDPFCLKERYLMSFASGKLAILPFTLPDAITGDLDRMIEVVSDIRARAREAGVQVTGVPVHTALTAGACRREIGWLTWFSLAFIAVLSVFVFRSVKWLPLIALSLGVSCLAGAAALFAGFDSVHILTLVFGTTVLGLVIDYSFHWLLAEERGSALKRNLTVSWLTTEISLLPLMLSSLPVLRQTAVFLAVALAAALAFVVFAYPRRCLILTFSLFLFPFYFSGCDRVKTDPAAIYRPPEELLETEKWLSRELNRDRPEVAANIALLYQEQGAKVADALGLDKVELGSVKVELASECVDTNEPHDSNRHEKTLNDSSRTPKEMLERMLDRLTRETLLRLGLALGCMFAALVGFFRARALRVFLPSALALAGVFAATLALFGSVNLFHLLAMFLLAGMSIDYTVFLHNGGRAAFKPALCSLLTSMAGFGALYFVSFPVVSAFGFVLGFGLPLAFLLALATRKPGAGAPPPPHQEVVTVTSKTEFVATPLGMELLFLFYRVFGLSALRFGAAAVGVAAYLASRSVRRASPRLAKVVNFTRSLADKLVVMAEGRRLPRIVMDGSPDAKEFLGAVQNRRGAFVLSSHVGTIEVLAALGESEATFHAWMEFERTGIFNRFYLRHARRRKVVIHPISEFGMGTVFEAGELIDSGECLLMAGDRGDGAFRFAAAFDHPVYFIACIAEGAGYRAIVRRLPDEAKAMREKYFEILQELKLKHPDQVFEWNRQNT